MIAEDETPPLPPDEAIAELLPPDVRGDLVDLRHPAAVDVWYGVVWSRLGRGDLAWAWWDHVDADDLQPWIRAERGRTLRELGLHEAAEEQDRAGLEAASDVVDVVMLRLSLVADAIGRGNLEAAMLRRDAVVPLLGSLPDSPRAARQRLRRTWIDVEFALAGDREPPVDGLPQWDPDDGAVLPADYDHGSTFHAAKGLLFGGVARGEARLLDAAADIAPPILAWAVHLARADAGREGALEHARAAWALVVPPPGYAPAVAETDHACRLTP